MVSGRKADAAGTSRILTVVFTDLADSTGLKAWNGQLPEAERRPRRPRV
jgi:hypothetical protein